MGKFLYKLEQKYGKYAVKDLTKILLACFGIGYVLSILPGNIIDYLYLNPQLVLQGQVWRLVTWVLVPWGSSNLIFILIFLLCFYSLGNALEYAMGRFRFNLFVFSGLLFTVLGAFVLYVIARVQYADIIEALGENGLYQLFVSYNPVIANGEPVLPLSYAFRQFTTYYVKMSMFFAFSLCYPEATIYFYYVIPLKAKYMGVLYAVLMALEFFQGDITSKVIILASFLNVILFFFTTRSYQRLSPSELKRRRDFKEKMQEARKAGNSAVHQGRNVITRHKCAICGRTELDDDTLEFRFCSKCEGNFEYCMDHLYTHEHVKRIVPGGTKNSEE